MNQDRHLSAGRRTRAVDQPAGVDGEILGRCGGGGQRQAKRAQAGERCFHGGSSLFIVDGSSPRLTPGHKPPRRAFNLSEGEESMATQPSPDVPVDVPMDDPVPTPTDPVLPTPSDPVVGAGGDPLTEGP